MENCLSGLCTHQRPLNRLQTAISKLLGGPWLGLDGPSGHYVGPHGCSSTRTVTKSSPKPIPGAIEGFRKKANFGNLAGVTKQPTQRQFEGFWGGHGSGYMGLAATMRVPMGAQVPVLSLHHHPNPSQGRQKGFRKSPILEILQVSLNSLSSVKTTKSSLARAHRGGQPGVPGVRTRDPRHGLGGPCTRKKLPRTWVQIHTQHPEYAKKF